MTGRRPLDDAELVERLGALSRRLAWPPAPDLSGRVVAALEAEGPATRPTGARAVVDRVRALAGAIRGATATDRGVGVGGRRVARRSLLIAVIALLAIAVAAAAIGIGVPGIRIDLGPPTTPGPPYTPAATATTPRPSSSTALASPSPTARVTPPGQELGLLVGLDEARSGAGFGLLLPTVVGYAVPAEVHMVGARPYTRVTLTYADGSQLTEFLGEIQPDAFQKVVGGGTTVDPVRVGASDGWWIAGAPHQMMLEFRDPDGQLRWQEVTVTGNVLIWQAGTVTLRLETPLDRAAAIALGVSLR